MPKTEHPHYVVDVMTKDVVCVDENEHLSHLLDSMHALRFRHLPVTNEGRLVGLLTERDILGLSASNLLPNRSESDELLQKRYFVRDVMTRDVSSVKPETPLVEAGRSMLKHRVDCLPVVNDDNRLVGIVTSADFVELAVRLVGAR